MKIVVQNAINASVSIDNNIVGKIDKGYVLLVGFTFGDNKAIVEKMADKLISLRLFNDENGKTNLSLADVNGSILSISQFTLYASVKDGRRPSFVDALSPKEASDLYDYFNEYVSSKGVHLEKGVFGADMKVSFTNDGPFTIVMDSKELVK